MPESFMTLFPHMLNILEAMKVPIQVSSELADAVIRSQSYSFDLMKRTQDIGYGLMKNLIPSIPPAYPDAFEQLLNICQEGSEEFLSLVENSQAEYLRFFRQERLAELEFIKVFTEELPSQDWTVEYDDTKLLLDLPGLRLIDISADVQHKILNYGVVFAPRAGHHSNIAERVALFMRDHGLTRMAIVEQKCAQDIPLYVEGERHYEGFDGQVEQYKQVLAHLRDKTGYPPHLVAICQPGPLLLSTLLLYPHLGKTFGSAGAPMDTEGEKGYLTDFARLVGEKYIDRLVTFLGHTITDEHPGAGRESYDGRIHVLGFYFLGMDQHFKNFRRLFTDLKQGKEEDVERQKVFYQWYNFVHHSPIGFIGDTYKKIFVRNELIHGELVIQGKKLSIKDYPGSVPIWALGGSKDDIAPSGQATGHMARIDSVPPGNKLTLICEAGHMGLFRSTKVLNSDYSRIVEFLLTHSDKVNT